MQFFKHYHSASDSEFVQLIEEKYGLVGYARWMKLLELLCDKLEDSFVIRVTRSEVAKKLRIKPANVEKILAQFTSEDEDQKIIKLRSNQDQAKSESSILIIEAPILWDLKDRDFKKARKDRALSAPKREEERDKKKEKEKNNKKSFSESENLDEFIPYTELVSPKVDFARIADLFNSVLAGNGKIKSAPFFCPPKAIEDFRTITGFKEFQSLETWESYFNQVKQSDFLLGKSKTGFVASLLWLIKSDNAFKVMNGQYQNGSDSNMDKLKEQMDQRAREYDEEQARNGEVVNG